MGIENLLKRMSVRETSRAIIAKATDKGSTFRAKGAIVTAATPGSGIVTVHIDGDPPGESRDVAVSNWELYDVGQRVWVDLWPPAGARMTGPSGPAAPWIPYPADIDPWYSANRKTPTFSNLDGDSGEFPGSISSRTFASVDFTAGKCLMLTVSALEMGTSTSNPITSVTNTGVPLTWVKLISRHDVLTTGSGYSPYVANQEIWWAYSPVAQSNVDVTWTYTNAFIPAPIVSSLQEVTDAEPIQYGVGATGGAGPDTNLTMNLTTTIDHSVIIACTMGTDYTGGVLTVWDVNAAASNTILQANGGFDAAYPWFATSEWRGAGHTRRAVTTPASTSVGISTAIAADKSLGHIAVEIVGVPDVPVIGDGILTASYRLKGLSLELGMSVDAGSTTTFGGGPHAFRLPPGVVASSRKPRQSIGGSMTVNGTTEYRLRAVILAGSTDFLKILYQDGSSTFLSGTTPAALGSTFQMDLGGVIEVEPVSQ